MIRVNSCSENELITCWADMRGEARDDVILISNGPSNRNENPRSGSSSCIEETPRSNTTPSTKLNEFASWMVILKFNPIGSLVLLLDMPRLENGADKGPHITEPAADGGEPLGKFAL
jgi:hypothetical protein